LEILHYPILSNFPELQHFCTTRHGGVSSGNYESFNLSPYTSDVAENQQANIKLLAEELQIPAQKIIFPHQTHGNTVKIITSDFLKLSEADRIAFLEGVDALITTIPSVCIGVTTADCVPILLYDSVKKVIAVAHAGWRGTCSCIVENTVKLMQSNFGTSPSHIVASIGVSISPEVYKVGVELVEAFEKQGFPVEEIFIKRNNHQHIQGENEHQNEHQNELYLDLWKANKWLLIQNGVPENQVEVAGICSYTNSNDYFSARRLGLKSGRMLSGLFLK